MNSNVYHEEDKMSTVAVQRSKTYDIVYIAVFAVIMAICSWISIPAAVPFTLQTFGVFIAAGVLGGKRGTLSVLVFILLGAVGIPVFANFSGGIGVLVGPTGGYIIGFLFSALVMWAMEKLPGKKSIMQIVSMVVGLVVCYAFGTAWFMVVYGKANGPVGLVTALGWCVFPFIIPDLIKIALAYVLSRKLRKYVA
ncbi:biotin transporter BioY [Blautia sp.]